MAPTVWQDQTVDQFREIGSRLASVMQNSIDRAGTMNQFAEAINNADAFTDLLIEYSSRWFSETGGRSTLIGPELFWLLSEPGPRRGAGSRMQESHPDPELTTGQRSRKLLLLCVYEAMTQTQWVPETVGDHHIVSVNGVG